MTEIEKILTPEQIERVREQIRCEWSYRAIREPFKSFDKEDSAIFAEFYNNERAPKAVHFGYKTFGSTEEELKELYPDYTWKKLSKEEKEFYRNNDKRLRKTQPFLFTKKIIK